MEKKIAIKISYYGVGHLSNTISDDYKEADKFLEALDEEYDVMIDRKPGGFAGGINEFFIHVILSAPFKDYILGGILGGLAYDLLKEGSKLSLSSFFKAYERLKENNRNSTTLDIASIRFEFQEVDIFLYGVFNESLPTKISELTQELTKYYKDISEYDDLPIKEIHIPILYNEDFSKEFGSPSNYSVPVILGMPNLSDQESYFKFWGLKYKYQHKKFVFKLENKKVFEEEWNDPAFHQY